MENQIRNMTLFEWIFLFQFVFWYFMALLHHLLQCCLFRSAILHIIYFSSPSIIHFKNYGRSLRLRNILRIRILFIKIFSLKLWSIQLWLRYLIKNIKMVHNDLLRYIGYFCDRSCRITWVIFNQCLDLLSIYL